MVKIRDEILPKTLGQHTRLGLTFRWTLNGEPVDLQNDGYTVRVWVTAPDGTTVDGPKAVTDVTGDDARYVLDVNDLSLPSPQTSAYVRVVAVAENAENTLVSDARAITVGGWGGADDYEPAT